MPPIGGALRQRERGVSRQSHGTGAAWLHAVAVQSIALGKSAEPAQAEMVRAASMGAQILTLDDPAYPPLLKQIYDPLLHCTSAAIRKFSRFPALESSVPGHPTYGLGMAERLACDLSAREIIIISGMARGVDTAAHRGALAAKAKTAAVFGTGIDVYYPRENSRLADQILAFGGALVSGFLVGSSAAPQNFTIRNRIISGL